ncbi:uncharacterized protein LOC127585900 isoform X2 [Pristis pectinata]|uniref:uncharacterized protein LOC127585900 isoform X2 n=1 Tax=Pristis pectinata TaxID=685728 RepID=UPI00223E5D6B|nr:uncharacterized protein LOC127585900 isoform X2 [Pristis pectinata]
MPPPLARLSLLLLVLGLVTAADKREEVVGALGSSVLLDPKIAVDPSKDKIIWRFITGDKSPVVILHHIPGYPKWAEPSEQFESRLQFIPSNGSLMISRLTAGDQGNYSFTVERQERNIIHLLLFGELSEALILTNSGSLGSTVQLTCNVSGDPHEYRWWKDGGEISRHHWLMDENRTLVIPGASGHDCGMYTCVAVNPVSSVHTDHPLIIPGFPPEDITIVTLSITDLVISVVLLVFVQLRCWKTESDEGASPVPVVGCCIVLAQLLDLTRLFTVHMLHHPCSDSLQKNIGVWDWAGGGLHLAVVIISVTSLTVIHQNNPGCDSSLFTGSVFFSTRIGSAVICLLYFVVPHCRNKDTSGNVNTTKRQQELQELRTTTSDHTADPESLPPDSELTLCSDVLLQLKAVSLRKANSHHCLGFPAVNWRTRAGDGVVCS